jgi:hypothetical protein
MGAVVRRLYGSSPLHLLVALGCLALAGYAALAATANPLWPWMLAWFAAAIIAHDLVLFPAYAAGDRLLVGVFRGGVNLVRVPFLGSALTFALFFPGIVRQGEPAFRAATGLDQEPYLARWLLLTSGMFAVSALVLLLRVVAGGARQRFRLRSDRSAAPASRR